MTITYREDGPWGTGKGSMLSSVEGDTNFYTLEQSIETLNGGKAENGANGDITSLSGLTTPLSVDQGGTGANDAADARTALDVPRTEDVGLVYLGTATVSGGLADLTPLMDNSRFDDYRLVGSGFKSTVGAPNLQCANAGTWSLTGYYYAGTYAHFGAPSSALATASVSATGAIVAVQSAGNNMAGYSTEFVADVIGVASGMCKVLAVGAAHISGDIFFCNYISKMPSVSVTGLRILDASAATLTAGTVKLYGYRKTA